MCACVCFRCTFMLFIEFNEFIRNSLALMAMVVWLHVKSSCSVLPLNVRPKPSTRPKKKIESGTENEKRNMKGKTKHEIYFYFYRTHTYTYKFDPIPHFWDIFRFLFSNILHSFAWVCRIAKTRMWQSVHCTMLDDMQTLPLHIPPELRAKFICSPPIRSHSRLAAMP